MPTNFDNAVPIVNLPFLYINGLHITNDATTPNTKINISAGICRDSTNSFDINLGNYLGANPNISASTSTTLDASVRGLNGIDTGTFAASKVYLVYAIADVVSANPSGVIMSLALPSAGGPVLPTGYNVSRHIGYAVSDASTHFLIAYIAGNNNYRKLRFDAPQATALTSGNATSYTAVSLLNWVPPVENLPVSIAYSFTPGAASRVLNITPGNATGNAVTITGQVTSVVVSGNAEILSKVTSSIPEVDYKVSNSGDAVAINVAGFDFFL